MAVESAYDPLARGDLGEVGLMQVLPSTAALMGFTGSLEALGEPRINVAYGAQYLAEAWRLASGDICTTVMKYRAGHGETRFSVRSVDYCVKVRARLKRAGFKVTGSVPKPTFGFNQVQRLANGRIRVRFPGTGKCFARVVQPGPRFGACIPRSVLRKKKLLR
jgi:soluble lytic murein transglycosylase-like protein